jgi:hypothetical protein
MSMRKQRGGIVLSQLLDGNHSVVHYLASRSCKVGMHTAQHSTWHVAQNIVVFGHVTFNYNHQPRFVSTLLIKDIE